MMLWVCALHGTSVARLCACPDLRRVVDTAPERVVEPTREYPQTAGRDMKAVGRMGGTATKARMESDPEYFRRIGALGGKTRARNAEARKGGA